jgi:GxxExxY protein
MSEDELSNIVIGCALRVHRKLGPGLLESAYRICLCYELEKHNIQFEMEKPMPIVYEEIKLNHGYRMDILVDGKLVIEIKTVEEFTKVHFEQLMTYLRLGNYKLGLLINFHVGMLKDGLKRIIN